MKLLQCVQCLLQPATNVWRHLRFLGFTMVRDEGRSLFVLKLLTALYGLVNGPLIFQMAFLHYLITVMGFHSSLHDDNFLFRYEGKMLAAIV